MQKTETEEDRKVRLEAFTAAGTLACQTLTMSGTYGRLSYTRIQRKQMAAGTAASTATTQTFMQLSTDMQVRDTAGCHVAVSPPYLYATGV